MSCRRHRRPAADRDRRPVRAAGRPTTSAGWPTWPRRASSVSTDRHAWATGPGSRTPTLGWRAAPLPSVHTDTLDLQAVAAALDPDYRTTAEDRGVEVLEGARARRCRIAVDGYTFELAFPQLRWLVGSGRPPPLASGSSTTGSSSTARSARWPRSVNGEAVGIVPDALQGTVEVSADRHGARPELRRLSSDQMTLDDERGRYATKRDRLARLTRLVSILQAHPDGIRTAEVAERVGMSVRTVYRDLRAIDEEIGVPVWADGGRWGIDQEKAFLPPLKLTQGEAMAVVLSARLMVRYADKYDPDLASAFEKLEQGLPPALAEHVERTLDVLSKAPRDEAVQRERPAPDQGLGGATGRRHRLRAGPLRRPARRRGRRRSGRTSSNRRSRPTPSTSSGTTRTARAIRTFKIERIRAAALTPRTFEPPDPARRPASLRAAWDIIADQEPPSTSCYASRLAGCVPGPRSDLASHADPWLPTRMVRSAGAPRCRAPSRSACGSWPGATTWRSSRQRSLRTDVAATFARAAEPLRGDRR